MIAHTHTCADCGYLWPCMAMADKPKAKVCIVAEAARSNKQGPFCYLCLKIREVEAAADLRGIKLMVVREISDPRPPAWVDPLPPPDRVPAHVPASSAPAARPPSRSRRPSPR